MINRHQAIANLIREAERRAIQAKVPAHVYLPHLMALETSCVKAVIADEQRLLSECDSIGSRAVAERKGVTPGAIRKRRRRIRLRSATNAAP